MAKVIKLSDSIASGVKNKKGNITITADVRDKILSSSLSSAHIKVLLSLMLCGDAGVLCTQEEYTRLSKISGVSMRSTSRAINRLSQSGFITISKANSR